MAETSLKGLLTLLEIEQVIVVDDLFVPPAALYTIAYGEGEGPELEGLPPLPEGADYETHVQEHWHEVPLTVKLKLQKELKKARDFVDPIGDPLGLHDLTGSEVHGMTLHEWREGKSKVLRSRKRALVLFDVNFSGETGESDDETGLELAHEALEAASDHVFGILTDKAGIGEEEAKAEKWAARTHLDRADLVVINKQLIANPMQEDEVATFTEQFRGALQASRIKALRETVKTALEKSITAVSKSVGEETPRIVEDIVFRASREGGEWEGDTWFRLYATLGLHRAHQEVARDRAVRSAIEDVRNLLHSRSHNTHEGAAALAAEVESAEAYADPSYLNEAGLPVANGDLFKSGSDSVFVLVGQPCDLALRPDGRAKDPSEAMLLRIVSFNDQADATGSVYWLPPGGPLGEGNWAALLRPEYRAAFDVLDLVSFNSAGRAMLPPPKGKELKPLLPGLQRRLGAIEKTKKKADELLSLIDNAYAAEVIDKNTANRVRHRILGDGGPFKATLGGKPTPFAFKCQRIGRLTGTYADGLLAAHAAARSRTVHAHDLTRIAAE
jgi:hypothetical protein